MFLPNGDLGRQKIHKEYTKTTNNSKSKSTNHEFPHALGSKMARIGAVMSFCWSFRNWQPEVWGFPRWDFIFTDGRISFPPKKNNHIRKLCFLSITSFGKQIGSSFKLHHGRFASVVGSKRSNYTRFARTCLQFLALDQSQSLANRLSGPTGPRYQFWPCFPTNLQIAFKFYFLPDTCV